MVLSQKRCKRESTLTLPSSSSNAPSPLSCRRVRQRYGLPGSQQGLQLHTEGPNIFSYCPIGLKVGPSHPHFLHPRALRGMEVAKNSVIVNWSVQGIVNEILEVRTGRVLLHVLHMRMYSVNPMYTHRRSGVPIASPKILRLQTRTLVGQCQEARIFVLNVRSSMMLQYNSCRRTRRMRSSTLSMRRSGSACLACRSASCSAVLSCQLP